VTTAATGLTVASIHRYPVKSCRGESLARATVEHQGLAGDRRYMVVDANGLVLTAREQPRLLLATPALTRCGLRLAAPGMPELEVATPAAARAPVRIWRSTLDAAVADDAAHAWFSDLLGVPVRLVHQDDPASRATNPAYSLDTDRVSLADGYPVLVATQASLTALNDWIAEGPLADEGPLPMTRFRPNVVVAGGRPWAEDGWRVVRIGAARFRAVKGCDRCVITTTDPADARRGKEPIATLARHRRWDGATWFAMNLVPDTPGVDIAVGDQVEVLESVDAPDGPPR
jgi:uncharacterized protein YcbX